MPGAWHGAYLKPYALLFAALKDTEDSIFEAGVDGAGSLLMYADYFHRSKPFGMDISPEPHALKGQQRIKFYQGDAYSPKGFETIRAHAPFALCVDDGPHTISSQITFCQRYPTLLSENGLAICEDVQHIGDFVELSRALPPDFFGFGIDLRMHDGRYDNLVFVITRR